MNDRKVFKVEIIKKLNNCFVYSRKYTVTIEEAREIMVAASKDSLLYCMDNNTSARTILKQWEIHCYTVAYIKGTWCWFSLVVEEEMQNQPEINIDITSLNEEEANKYWTTICSFIKQHNRELHQ